MSYRAVVAQPEVRMRLCLRTESELRAAPTKWIGYYNAGRPHSRLGGQTPDEAYGVEEVMRLAS
jgi:transposase InsO family protein